MIEQELIFWQILSFVILGCYMTYVAFDIIFMKKFGQLRKYGHLETKKGTYTFTPKEKSN